MSRACLFDKLTFLCETHSVCIWFVIIIFYLSFPTKMAWKWLITWLITYNSHRPNSCPTNSFQSRKWRFWLKDFFLPNVFTVPIPFKFNRAWLHVRTACGACRGRITLSEWMTLDRTHDVNWIFTWIMYITLHCLSKIREEYTCVTNLREEKRKNLQRVTFIRFERLFLLWHRVDQIYQWKKRAKVRTRLTYLNFYIGLSIV